MVTGTIHARTRTLAYPEKKTIFRTQYTIAPSSKTAPLGCAYRMAIVVSVPRVSVQLIFLWANICITLHGTWVVLQWEPLYLRQAAAEINHHAVGRSQTVLARDISLLLSDQYGSRTHPPFYPMSSSISFPRGKDERGVKLLPALQMRRALLPP